MTFIPGSDLSVYCFSALVSGCLVAIAWAAFRFARLQFKKVCIFLIYWTIGSSAIVYSGALLKYQLPALPLFFVALNLSAIYFGISEIGKSLTSVPTWMLVVFQSFRLPLELILHNWSQSQTVPETMTWTGQNFDIVTGVLALGAFVPALRVKQFFWVFNLIGIFLLLNVVRVVILSSGLPFSWPLERPLQLALYLPYALIATVCVWSAFVGHIILTRKLLRP
jgi:hypothetical protein